MTKKVEVNNDKMAALQEALKKIEKDFGTGSVMRLDEAPELDVDVIANTVVKGQNEYIHKGQRVNFVLLEPLRLTIFNRDDI